MLNPQRAHAIAVVPVLLFASALSAQKLNITVITTESKTTLSAASILINSGHGYLIGSVFQNFRGIHVTDAAVPPKGFKLKSSIVNWNDLRQIEFVDWDVKEGDQRFTKARITLAAGPTREVFLWNPGSNDSLYSLVWSDIKIVGKLNVKGSEQEVETVPGRTLKSLEFSK